MAKNINKYNQQYLSKLWIKKISNKLIRRGYRIASEKTIIDLFDLIKKNYKLAPIDILIDIVKQTSTPFTTPPRRKGIRIHQIPSPTSYNKSINTSCSEFGNYLYKLPSKNKLEILNNDITNLYYGGLSSTILQSKIKQFSILMNNKTYTNLRWR